MFNIAILKRIANQLELLADYHKVNMKGFNEFTLLEKVEYFFSVLIVRAEVKAIRDSSPTLGKAIPMIKAHTVR